MLIKRFAEVTGYCENAVRHRTQNGTSVNNSYVTFDVREGREHHQQGGSA
ncbi:hypothetical protein [Hydrogenophaga sp.]|nr:hypothetical protein [Hydrogenophaga sp.]